VLRTMAPAPDLDDELQSKILMYVTEPRACLSCHTWKTQLYDSLKLEPRIRFMQQLLPQGSVAYCYNAVRPLGEDFEESVGYNFKFEPDGTYSLMWTRTFDAWSSQCEQQIGRWRIFMDHVCCETIAPSREVSETEVRFAPPGYKFAIMIEDILAANGGYFQAKDGTPAALWEMPARTGKDDDSKSVWTEGMWTAIHHDSNAAATQFRAPVAENARFVEIDGELHEVSNDIVENYPEEQWVRLMSCRIRFGING